MTITGMAISVSQGVMERALACFPAALDAYRRGMRRWPETPMPDQFDHPTDQFHPLAGRRAGRFAKSLNSASPDRETLRWVLSTRHINDIHAIRRAAERTLLENCGDTVRLRGLIEFSNRCTADCYSGRPAPRSCAKALHPHKRRNSETASGAPNKATGRSCSGGEQARCAFITFIGNTIRAIKDATRSERLPTASASLCRGRAIGKTTNTEFKAGAHRYLLTHGKLVAELFAKLHPTSQHYESRIECLLMLKRIGYGVGTGVMIGLPGQTIDDLLDDIYFFRDVGTT